MLHITKGTFGLGIGLQSQWPCEADIASNIVQTFTETKKKKKKNRGELHSELSVSSFGTSSHLFLDVPLMEQLS